MLLEAIGPPGRCRGGVVMIYWFRVPRVNPSYQVHAREGQAVVCPLLRGRSPTRSVAPKPLRGLGRAPLRLPWAARVPNKLARRNMDLLVSPARCCSRAIGPPGPGRGDVVIWN